MIHYKQRYLWTISIQFILFSLISLMVKTNFQPFLYLENTVTNTLQQLIGTPPMNYSGGFINDSMTFLATYGDVTSIVILSILISGILFFKHYTLLGFWLLGVISTGGVIGVYLKHLVQRARPINHLPLDNGFSFPSGHAVGSTLFFAAILFVLIPAIRNQVLKKISIGLCVIAWFGILISRIYFSAHHLGDVLAGVSFGLFWVFSAMVIYSWVAAWFQRHVFKKSII